MKNEKLFEAMGDMDEAFLAKNMEEVKIRRKDIRWWERVAVAAVAAVALMITATLLMTPPQGAAVPEEPREVYENADAVLNALYGKYEDYDPAVGEKYLKPYIYPVSGSVTMEGFTLTAEAAVFDPVTGCAFLYYSIENPDGLEGYWENVNKVYEANETGEYDFGPNYPKVMSNYGHGGFFDEANSTDTKHYMLMPLVYSEELWTNTESMTKQAIEAGLGDRLEEVLAGARGENITLYLVKVGGGRTDAIVIRPDPVTGMEWETLDGGNMRLSAIGLTLMQEPYEQKEGPLKGAFDVHTFHICFADGSKYLLEVAEYDEDGWLVSREENYRLWCGYGSTRNSEEYVTIMFDRIIDLDQVVAVELNGVVYPVDQYE